MEEDKKKAVFEILLIPNYELESLFLSFGESVRVVKPASLANKLTRRLEESVKNYR
jgi:predicted DNA-binding transcriptional regulator YafY